MTSRDATIHDDEGVRRRRALYRACHRGTKEMDFILGRFATARVPDMSPARLAAFEELLALEDPVLRELLAGAVSATGEQGAIVAELLAFHGLNALPLPTGRR
jgi:antitoxin CptB